MKIQNNKIEGKDVVQIFLSSDEKEDTHVQEQICAMKSKHKNIVLFVSGENETDKSLKNIINLIRQEITAN